MADPKKTDQAQTNSKQEQSGNNPASPASTPAPTTQETSKTQMNKTISADGSSVVIGCTLPQGVSIVIDGKPIHIKGVNAMSSKRSWGGTGFTRMPLETWEKINTQYKDWDPLRKGFIFLSPNNDL